MHDLNTINKLNHDAWAGQIGELQRVGRFVIAEYTGSTLVAIHDYATSGEALAAYSKLQAQRGTSVHAKPFFPATAEAVTALAHALHLADRNTPVGEEILEGSTTD